MVGDKIRELRKASGLTQEELGKKVGVIKQTISGWENNVASPSYEAIDKLSEIFGVSGAYLLGFTDDVCGFHDAENGVFFFFFDEDLKTIFTTRLNKSMEAANMERDDILFETEIKGEHLDKYLIGESEPSLEDLCMLSDVLGVTTDYLLGRDPEPTAKSHNMIHAFGQLDEDNQDIIIGETKKLLKEQKRFGRPVAAESANEAKEMVN